MPLVRISLVKGKPADLRRGIGNAADYLGNLVEVAKENWSFGNGVASYAPEAVTA